MKRVLPVDDDAAAVESGKAMLKALSYKVTVASNGSGASRSHIY